MIRIVIICSIVAFFSSCTDNISKSAIKSNRTLWDSQSIENYEVDIDISCFCPVYNPARLVVCEDTISEILDPSTGLVLIDPYDSIPVQDKYKDSYYTIDELFDYLERTKKANPHKLDVIFNNIYGYPEFIDSDPDKKIVDEELYVTIMQFTPQ